MPVYEFKCDRCGAEREELLPRSQAGDALECQCGNAMRRRFSLSNFRVPRTGRDKVLSTLNRDEGSQTYPGGEMYSKRYDQALAKGIDGSQRTSQSGQYRPVNGAKA